MLLYRMDFAFNLGEVPTDASAGSTTGMAWGIAFDNDGTFERHDPRIPTNTHGHTFDLNVRAFNLTAVPGDDVKVLNATLLSFKARDANPKQTASAPWTGMPVLRLPPFGPASSVALLGRGTAPAAVLGTITCDNAPNGGSFRLSLAVDIIIDGEERTSFRFAQDPELIVGGSNQ
jgi:hypothetical protein